MLTSAFNTPKTEVTNCRWVDSKLASLRGRPGLERVTGWVYQTANNPDPYGWCYEESLRKLPPAERISWVDCAWQPKELSHDK